MQKSDQHFYIELLLRAYNAIIVIKCLSIDSPTTAQHNGTHMKLVCQYSIKKCFVCPFVQLKSIFMTNNNHTAVSIMSEYKLMN